MLWAAGIEYADGARDGRREDRVAEANTGEKQKANSVPVTDF